VGRLVPVLVALQVAVCPPLGLPVVALVVLPEAVGLLLVLVFPVLVLVDLLDGGLADLSRSRVARGGQVLLVRCGHDLAVRETTSLPRKPLLRL